MQARVVMDDSRTIVVVAGVSGNSVLSGKAPRGFVGGLQTLATRILRGCFRGARVMINPRYSLRKIFGLYKHELNACLETALWRVNCVLDVAANDGYFTFGCAAAFRRLGKPGEIFAFEPQARRVATLRESVAAQPPAVTPIRFEVVQALVGKELKPGMTTLDAVHWTVDNRTDRTNTLIKIDVEGAEMEVIGSGHSWLRPSNLFLIEAHYSRFLDPMRAIFAEHGLRLVQVNQRPLPVLSRERRQETNCWLVSDIGA
jgi:hypothetical protein